MSASDNISPRQFGVPIPEGTSIKHSGGMGHIEGSGSSSITKMLPVATLKKYVEYDRTDSQSEKTINSIANELRGGGVIKEPLMLEHNVTDQHGYLGEGHHRLLAAERAGHTHVPAFVFSSKHNDKVTKYKRSGIGAPLTLMNPSQWDPNNDGYQPKELHPGHFEEFQ